MRRMWIYWQRGPIGCVCYKRYWQKFTDFTWAFPGSGAAKSAINVGYYGMTSFFSVCSCLSHCLGVLFSRPLLISLTHFALPPLVLVNTVSQNPTVFPMPSDLIDHTALPSNQSFLWHTLLFLFNGLPSRTLGEIWYASIFWHIFQFYFLKGK